MLKTIKNIVKIENLTTEAGLPASIYTYCLPSGGTTIDGKEFPSIVEREKYNNFLLSIGNYYFHG